MVNLDQISFRFRYPRSTLTTRQVSPKFRATRAFAPKPAPAIPRQRAPAAAEHTLAGIDPAAPRCPRRPPRSAPAPASPARSRRTTASTVKQKFIENPQIVGRFREILCCARPFVNFVSNFAKSSQKPRALLVLPKRPGAPAAATCVGSFQIEVAQVRVYHMHRVLRVHVPRAIAPRDVKLEASIGPWDPCRGARNSP